MTDGKGLNPDYPLEDRMELTTIAQVRAIAEPLRESILDLLLERAATITDLAAALGRPKGTVAYHVKVLTQAGITTVVRTRRVRAVTENFYGRTARLHFVGALKALDESGRPIMANYLVTAAAESARAHADDDLTAILRRARIPREHLHEFRRRMFDLADEFSALPRGGEQAYGFVAAVYPTEHPHLPQVRPDSDDGPASLRD